MREKGIEILLGASPPKPATSAQSCLPPLSTRGEGARQKRAQKTAVFVLRGCNAVVL